MRSFWIPIISSIVFIGLFVIGPALQIGQSYSGIYTWESPFMILIILLGTWLLGFASCIEVFEYLSRTDRKKSGPKYKVKIMMDNGKSIKVNTNRKYWFDDIKAQIKNDNKAIMICWKGRTTKIDRSKITCVDYRVGDDE